MAYPSEMLIPLFLSYRSPVFSKTAFKFRGFEARGRRDSMNGIEARFSEAQCCLFASGKAESKAQQVLKACLTYR